jgi:hypothetical protein
MKIIGIIGCRSRDSKRDLDLLKNKFFEIYEEGDEIVSGGCPQGGDRFAEVIAKENGIPIKIYYPNWKKHGKSAGFKRNVFIAKDSDIILAVVSPERKGGTEHTIKTAKQMGIPIELIEDFLDEKGKEDTKNNEWDFNH